MLINDRNRSEEQKNKKHQYDRELYKNLPRDESQRLVEYSKKRQGKCIELTVLDYSVRLQSSDGDNKSSLKYLKLPSELSITKVLIIFFVARNFTDANTQLFFNHHDFSFVIVTVNGPLEKPNFLFIMKQPLSLFIQVFFYLNIFKDLRVTYITLLKKLFSNSPGKSCKNCAFMDKSINFAKGQLLLQIANLGHFRLRLQTQAQVEFSKYVYSAEQASLDRKNQSYRNGLEYMSFNRA